MEFIFEGGHIYVMQIREKDGDDSKKNGALLRIGRGYCGIILIRRDQCLWIIKIKLVRGDVILFVTGLRHYNARQFIISLNVLGDVNLWVRMTDEMHEH